MDWNSLAGFYPPMSRKIILENKAASAILAGMWNRTVWLIWLAVVSLALVLGYLLATPDARMSIGVTGLVLLVLSIPFFLRWHYPFLIFSWNAMMVPFFLPGRLDLWIIVTLLSLTISVLRRTIDKEATFLRAPSVTRSLLFFGAVVVMTAVLTGGTGLSILGSKTFGGKKYFFIFAAIAGYFALTAQCIPKERAKFYTILFFLSGLTAVVGNFAYMAGPSFYFLFALFPVEGVISQAIASEGVGDNVVRISGLAVSCFAVYCALLASNGIREVFNVRKPWKMALLLLAAFAGLLGGFRSVMVIFSLIFIFLFYIEGLHRTRFLPLFIGGIIFVAVIFLPFVSKLPFSVQRALSVLPIKVDPVARMDAQHSSEWRLQMWKIVVPQIPQYLLKGKGYTINPTDLYLAEQMAKFGLGESSDIAILAGDYHSGPLSLIIPFGIFGVIGFIWFLGASLQALYRNYRYGDPSLQRVNTFLFAYFLAKTVFFFSIFGAVNSDLFVFTGLIGFSISLNGGVKEKPVTKIQFQPESAVPALT